MARKSKNRHIYLDDAPVWPNGKVPASCGKLVKPRGVRIADEERLCGGCAQKLLEERNDLAGAFSELLEERNEYAARLTLIEAALKAEPEDIIQAASDTIPLAEELEDVHWGPAEGCPVCAEASKDTAEIHEEVEAAFLEQQGEEPNVLRKLLADVAPGFIAAMEKMDFAVLGRSEADAELVEQLEALDATIDPRGAGEVSGAICVLLEYLRGPKSEPEPLDTAEELPVPERWGSKVKLVGGERLQNVHLEEFCRGDACPIHKLTEHHMRAWNQHFREDRGMMERICSHGVGHPDPDDSMTKDRTHGCDGCCIGGEEPVEVPPEPNAAIEVPTFAVSAQCGCIRCLAFRKERTL